MIKIYNKKANCFNIAGVTFVSMVNEIDEKSYELLKSEPLFDALIKNGSFKVIKDVEKVVEEILEEVPQKEREKVKSEIKSQKVIGSIDASRLSRKSNKKEAE